MNAPDWREPKPAVDPNEKDAERIRQLAGMADRKMEIESDEEPTPD